MSVTMQTSQNEQGKACTSHMQEALSCLEGRWKLMILCQLFGHDRLRFSDLGRAIPKVSQKMLIQQLRQLETDAVVRSTVHPQVPPRVDYELTELGRSLRPVFVALLDWAGLRDQSASGATL
jgi:DNA-binding HxlR family transcriptional regulator